jgi:HSP20 family protein
MALPFRGGGGEALGGRFIRLLIQELYNRDLSGFSGILYAMGEGSIFSKSFENDIRKEANMIQRYEPLTSAWDPFREMTELRRAVNRLFGPSDGFAEAFPPLNIYCSDEEAVVSAEIPGVDKESLDISVSGSSFTLSGSREPVAAGKERSYLRRERFQGRFTRAVELPFNVEADKVMASLRDGILEVRLPRAESDKPRKIQIEA